MSQLQEAFARLRTSGWIKVVGLDKIELYIFRQQDAALAAVQPQSQNGGYWVNDITKALRRPDQLEDEDRRTIHVLARIPETHTSLWRYLDQHLANEETTASFHDLFRQELLGMTPVQVAAHTIGRLSHLTRNGSPTSAGRYALALTDQEIKQGLDEIQTIGSGVPVWRSGLNPHGQLTSLLLDHAPQRVPALLDQILRSIGVYNNRTYTFKYLLEKGQGRFEDAVIAAFDAELNTFHRFHQAQVIYDFNPAKYRDKTYQAAKASLEGPSGTNNHGPVGEWMIERFGKEAVPDLVKYLGQTQEDHWATSIMSAAVKTLGHDAIPILRAPLEAEPLTPSAQLGRRYLKGTIRLTALGHLIALHDPAQDALIQKELEWGLSQETIDTSYLSLAAKWHPERVEETIWKLLEHKSKQARDAAASALAKIGDAAVPRAATLLQHKKADVRIVAAFLLRGIATAPATDALEARVDVETHEQVRDEILLGRDSAWAKQGKKLSRQDITRRIERTAPKLVDPVARWVDESKLPALYWKGGNALSAQEVRYLLYRQSRAKEIRPDIEAKPMYTLLDRATSGPFATAILRGFIASGADSGDRWALAIAGLLGDDRLVSVLSSQIRDWVDNNRGKLAEYAVEALALLGTDAVLLAVDAMAIRYRNKMKNVGKAASEAFSAAAANLGISPDELGDRVVPWLGFSATEPRIVTCGKTRFEVSIGPDMKLAYKDLDKNKPAKSLPKSAPPEVLQEFKDVAANLREIIKAQLLRLENLLVRQRRWPAPRWRELFLRHPLLLPFAVRLAWGDFGPDGQLRGKFRALPDRSLTTRTDDTYTLPEDGTVAMIHPLEISQEERQLWQTHFADYEIQPPFPQMDRPVVLVPEDQRATRKYTALENQKVNGATFKGRAERLGWHRGSVVDGGSIVGYFKSFPAAGADVYIFVEGLYMGMDISDEITFEHALFLKTGSYHMGSYTYDEPRDETDPRVLAFGDVPAIVYSEAMSDMQKIAGKSQDAESE